MGYAIYNLVLTLLVICGFPVFLLFALRGRESRAVLRERLGFYPKSLLGVLRGERPIWLHAVSVGEVRSAAGLIQRLRQRFPGKRILLSTSTRAGKEMAVRMDAGADAVVFFPLDHPWVVGRILGQVEPLLLILLETEIWPNLLRLTHRRGIPILLLSGRLSPKAFRRYLWLRPFFSNVVRQFSMVGMQSQEYADRMIRLGVSPIRVRVTGSLKFSGSHKGVQRQRVDLGLNGRARRILVGGSTHRAEEEVLLDVFQDLRARFPGLLLVLAPRHPNRFAEVERLLRRKQVNYVRKSQLQRRDSNAADVIFLDTLGELAAVYGLGEIAFVGGSLVDAGGHNLMEPARWCKPLLFWASYDEF